MQLRPPLACRLAFAACALLSPFVPACVPSFVPSFVIGGLAREASAARGELCEVVQVVDGDTLHVRRNGALEKLRLSCVDTEEKLSGRADSDPDKPQTVFGEECALWAQRFFAELAQGGEPAHVGLAFPGSVEERDVYGRLLCHVTLPDGRDFNLLLVELGKSPYFNKYGNCLDAHERFVEAQRRARAAGLGIWNPETNAPRTPGAPAAHRDYGRLLPWWEARAQAIEEYRRERAQDPEHCASAERPAELAQAARACARGEEARVFGALDRLFDEKDGDLTVLFRAGAKERALRVRVAADRRGAHESLDLARRNASFRQNYLWVRGTLRETRHGFELESRGPDAWLTAGPEPVFAK